MDGRRQDPPKRDILSLHKRLHETNAVKVVENGFPELSNPRNPRPSRFDVKRYLGDPLPLPYAIESRTPKKSRIKAANATVETSLESPLLPSSSSLNGVSESPLRQKKVHRRIPKHIEFLKEQSNIRLRNSLRQFQEIRLQDGTPQEHFNEPLEEEQATERVDQSIQSNNEMVTPISSPVLKHPSPIQQNPTRTAVTKDVEVIHVSLKTLLSSPICTVLLLMLLYYILKTLNK